MSMQDRIDEAHGDSMRWFPEKAHDTTFILLALAGEVGEVANLLKKYERGSKTWEEIEKDLVEEIVDVQTYLNGLMASLGERRRWIHAETIDWDKEYDAKREFNDKRFNQLRIDATTPEVLPS